MSTRYEHWLDQRANEAYARDRAHLPDGVTPDEIREAVDGTYTAALARAGYALGDFGRALIRINPRE